jgi:hypothetical protein
MDNQEENLKLFPKRENIDWIQKAENMIPTYRERLSSFIQSSNGKLDEFDFAKNEIDKCSSSLHPKSQFTEGVKWTIYVKKIKEYKKFLFLKIEAIEEIKKNSPKSKKTDRYIRLYALNKFAPELMKKLKSKDLKKQVISLITGVNEQDSYQLLNNATTLEGLIDTEVKDSIDDLFISISEKEQPLVNKVGKTDIK